MRTRIFSFWHGPLTWIEQTCISSILAQGHPLTVYSYDPIDLKRSIDPRATVLDARHALPLSTEIDRQMAVKPALPANLIRYKLLEQSAGTWLDLDVLLLKPMPDLEYCFGYEAEDRRHVNNAILRLPADSPVLRDLIDFCEHRPVLAPWWTGRRKWRHKVWAAVGRPIQPEDCQWGVFGPKALTHFVRQHGLEGFAFDHKACYPVSFRDAADLVEPSGRVERHFSSETVAVHLWANKLRKISSNPPPPTSWLGQHISSAYA